MSIDNGEAPIEKLRANEEILNELEEARYLILKTCADQLSELANKEVALIENRDDSVKAIFEHMRIEDLCNVESAKFFYGLATLNKTTEKYFQERTVKLAEKEPYLAPMLWHFDKRLDVCAPIVNITGDYDQELVEKTFLLSLKILAVSKKLRDPRGLNPSLRLNLFYSNPADNLYYSLFDKTEDEGNWKLLDENYEDLKKITGSYATAHEALLAVLS